MTPRPPTTSPRHRGIAAFDVIAGILLVGTVGTALALVLTSHAKAMNKLADTRAAVRFAEQVLLDLQTGQPPPAPAASQQLAIYTVKADTRSADTVRWHWVRVEVRQGAARAELIGYVPGRAVAQTQPTQPGGAP